MSRAGPHLVVTTSHGSYALPAERVLEINWLPRLSEAPTDRPACVGTVDLRGRTMPVLDLDLALGRDPEPYGLDHQLVAVRIDGQPLGLVVEQALDVVDVTDDLVDEDWDESQHAVPALARLEDRLSGLLDLDALPEAPNARPATGSGSDLWVELGDQDRVELERRAEELAREARTAGLQARTRAVAVLGLGEEQLAIPLESAREFVRVEGLTPVPSTPPHVLGIVNHRGELVPVVDVTDHLGIDASLTGEGPVVVVDLPEGASAIAVDRVADTISVDEDDLVEPGGGDQPEGRVPYQDITITLVDPRSVLEQDAIVVEHEA